MSVKVITINASHHGAISYCLKIAKNGKPYPFSLHMIKIEISIKISVFSKNYMFLLLSQ